MKDIQDTERPRFATLQYSVLKQLKIKPTEYMLLDMVYHLSAKHGYCYKSIYAMAQDLNLTFNAVKAIVNRLIDRGLLDRSAAGLICGPAYINVAYLHQTGPVKVAPRKTSAKNAVVQKMHHAKTSLNSAKSSVNSAKTSDKNNNRSTLELHNPLHNELNEFIKMRKAKRNAPTPRALELIGMELEKLYPGNIEQQRACLNQSILRGWAGVFPIRDEEARSSTNGIKY